MVEEEWIFPNESFTDPRRAICASRGFDDLNSLKSFLYPTFESCQNSLRIPGLDSARDRILKALKDGDNIQTFGDFDCDGVCATTNIQLALQSLQPTFNSGVNNQFYSYIPDRIAEGYGLSSSSLDLAIQRSVGLVLTVDNGIVAFSQADYAKKLGLDLLITDHHIRKDTLPEAAAIVHTREMCGAAVAWVLMSDLLPDKVAERLLQYTAMATVGDVMELSLPVNRLLLQKGLEVLNKNPDPGVEILMDVAGVKKGQVDSTAIGFRMAPRINAVGRLESAGSALNLFCEDDLTRQRILAYELGSVNTRRQELTEEAFMQADQKVNPLDKIHVVLGDWHEGISGLVASRLVEKYGRPAIALTQGQKELKGSARSVDNFHIYEALFEASDLLSRFGGHAKAAGFSLLEKNLTEFENVLKLQAALLPDRPRKDIKIDAVVKLSQIDDQLIKFCQYFEPTGNQNPPPLLATRRVEVFGIKRVGIDGKHLKFVSFDPESRSTFPSIAFGKGYLAEILQNKKLADLIYTPEFNEHEGMVSRQLNVKGIRLIDQPSLPIIDPNPKQETSRCCADCGEEMRWFPKAARGGKFVCSFCGNN